MGDLDKLYKFLRKNSFYSEAKSIASLIKFSGDEKDREDFLFSKGSSDLIIYNDVDYDLVKQSYFKIIDYVIEMSEGFSMGDSSGVISDGIGKFFRDFRHLAFI